MHGRCGGLYPRSTRRGPSGFLRRKSRCPIPIALKRKPEFPRHAGRRRIRAGRAHEARSSNSSWRRRAWIGRSSRRRACRRSALAALRKAFAQAMNDPGFHRGSEEAEPRDRRGVGRGGRRDHRQFLFRAARIVDAAKEIMNIGASRRLTGGQAMFQDQPRRHRQPELRFAGRILQVGLQDEAVDEGAGRARADGRRRLCRAQHQSAQGGPAGRARPLRHRGRGRERRLRPHEEISRRRTAVQRPGTRPFAGITANDPDGNVFDLSQRDMANRDAIYMENTGERRRAASPTSRCARCIRTRWRASTRCLRAQGVEQAGGRREQYLTDGKVTLVLIPWRIGNYLGQSILPTGHGPPRLHG